MRKNIKFSASSIIIIISLMLGLPAYAEVNPNLEQILQSVKIKREEFKTELDASKEQAKLKIVETRANFTESLKKIKDEGKKLSAEKIVSTIQNLNPKAWILNLFKI